MDRDGPVYHAAVGAGVTVVASVILFSSILGGAVASYRAESGWLGGLGVGTLAGLFAAVPLLVLFVPALVIAILLGFGIGPNEPGFGVFLAIAFALFFLYTVGLSALGGVVGVGIRRYTEWDIDPGRFR